MLTSKNGRDEHAAKNNHGTWYYAQVIDFSLFTNDVDKAKQLVPESKERLNSQLTKEGKQPLELERNTTNPNSLKRIMEEFVGRRKRGDVITLYYSRLDRKIEKLDVYNDSLVMTMGNEVVVRKAPMSYAGLTLTRRYTHLWMKKNGKWQLAIRHANFICSEVKKQ